MGYQNCVEPAKTVNTSMNIFERILHDIKGGENIDLYVTVVAAVAFVTMNVFGIVPGTSLFPMILAFLGLLALSLLGNRHRLEEVRHLISAMSGSSIAFVDEFPSDFSARLDDARELWLIGTHHSAALTAYHQIFQNKLRSAGKLRFLLVDPNGAASKMAAMRFPGRVDPDQERMRILSSLQTLSALREVAPDKVEIRIIDFLVDYTAYVLDPESPSGVIYVERATYKTSGGARKPKFVYKRRDGRWFEHVRTEVGHLWESGTDWKAEAITGGS